MLYTAIGAAGDRLDRPQMKQALFDALDKLGPRNKVLALPPDFTRFHSQAGLLTQYVWEYYGDRLTAVLPALGTHSPMTETQIREMFGDMPPALFKPHDWRNDVVTLGTVPPAYVKEITEGKLDFEWPVQVNRLLVEGGFDLILSVGQVVPHEVIGMANYNKNLFVGTGGAVAINRSHFVGAVYGMERIIGRADTPVRKLFNYGSDHFGHLLPQTVYVQTVVGRADNGGTAVRGLYVGDDIEVFNRAAALALEVNFELVPKPFKKCVVYLDPSEFKSTWLGNKAVYRTRMAMADGGELLILAPGVKEFGEDKQIDALIRKYGYFGTPATLEAVKANADLQENLGAAAHLIHGSSEGRFGITYAAGHLTREEVEGAGFRYADINEATARYNPATLKDGINVLPGGEEIFYISNPAIGLWSVRERFQ
ncbi:MAG: lactate racemase domain-containing protein [Verrucomicrobiota bacterium]|jgi:nickel-dependent lactate racemase|nr:lactate racemase domain-containing protein [Verrucomicrobiota bacterium]